MRLRGFVGICGYFWVLWGFCGVLGRGFLPATPSADAWQANTWLAYFHRDSEIAEKLADECGARRHRLFHQFKSDKAAVAATMERNQRGLYRKARRGKLFGRASTRKGDWEDTKCFVWLASLKIERKVKEFDCTTTERSFLNFLSSFKASSLLALLPRAPP